MSRAAPSRDGSPIRVCFVCTHSLTMTTLYKGLFPYLESSGFAVTVIVGDDEYADFSPAVFGTMTRHVIPMKRLPDAISDLRALWRLVRFFRRNRFDVVHVSTPKASLLAAMAARLTGNGAILFMQRRIVYELSTGLKRWIYERMDWLTCAMADMVVPVSRQIGEYLVARGLCPRSKIQMVGIGSSNGIDTDGFSPSAVRPSAAMATRISLALHPTAPTLLFLGRICSEKGIDYLPAIFDRVRTRHPRVQMVVAGPDNERDPIGEDVARRLTSDPAIRRLGFVENAPPLFAAADVFVFPSRFEGLGNVLLEAAAMELCAVAFRRPGMEEAIADGVSGILVADGDTDALADAVSRLLDDREARSALGRAARRRVIALFDRSRIFAGIRDLLSDLAADRHAARRGRRYGPDPDAVYEVAASARRGAAR